MPTHLVKVKSKLFVRSRRRVVRAIDGEYASRARGHGFDFEDLREYRPGDSIRDIDWKATARRQEPLVRRYLTTRQRTLVVVADTAVTMNALTPAGEHKADLAVLAAGVLGFLALRHGDRVGLVHGDAASRAASRPREGERHLEALLTTVDTAIRTATAGPDLPALIDHAHTRAGRDAIVVVVSDDVEVDDRLEGVVRRVARARDVLWIGVADANPAQLLAAGPVADAAGRWRVPTHLARGDRLAAEYEAHAAHLRGRLADLLDDGAVSRCRIATEAEALTELLTMLHRRPYAR